MEAPSLEGLKGGLGGFLSNLEYWKVDLPMELHESQGPYLSLRKTSEDPVDSNRRHN